MQDKNKTTLARITVAGNRMLSEFSNETGIKSAIILDRAVRSQIELHRAGYGSVSEVIDVLERCRLMLSQQRR